MKKRAQAKQLTVGDHFRIKETSGLFQVEDEPQNGGGFVRLVAKLVPCSPECSTECDCLHALFGQYSQPLSLCLKPDDRLTYFGNLKDLLAQSEAIQKRIELLRGTDSDQETGDFEPQQTSEQ